VADLNFRSAFIKVERMYENKIEHPKIAELKRLVSGEIAKNKEVKMIIFTQYRDSAVRIKEELDSAENARAQILLALRMRDRFNLVTLSMR